MIKRPAFATAAFLALTVVPARAQQHPHGQGMHQGTAMMMSCPTTQQMMQGMYGQGTAGMHGQRMGMRGQGTMGMHGHTGGATMGAMGSLSLGPGMLLRVSDALGLTPEQVEQLTALRERTRDQQQAQMQAASDGCRTAASALEGDAPDLDAYAEALNEVADHMVAAQVTLARTAIEARELLTAEQIGKLDDVLSTAHGPRSGGMM